MKKLLFVLCALWSLYAVAVPRQVVQDLPAKLDFRSVPVAQLVQLIYSEMLKESFVIDPEVQSDQRVVSLRYDSSKGDVRAFATSFLDSLGLSVSRRGTVDYIARKPAVVPAPVEPDVFIYRPRYRDGSYLVDLLGPIFKGSFTSKRAVHAAPGEQPDQRAAPPGSAAALVDHKTDTLVFTGTAMEIERLKKLMPQVDIATGDVLVRGVLYEVQTGSSDGSAFKLALTLLGGKFGVGFGSVGASPGDSFITFKNNSIDAVLSALSTDTRFKAVSKPTLRVTSGGSGRFVVGEDVPVLGSVAYPGNGAPPVQSVTYQSSGVIYELQPVLHESSIDVTVLQQTSNFVSTITGVNTSPTLIKRELKSDLNLADGEVVVMGGLSDSKDTDSGEGLPFLPSFLRTHSQDKQNVEILLILQVTKI